MAVVRHREVPLQRKTVPEGAFPIVAMWLSLCRVTLAPMRRLGPSVARTRRAFAWKWQLHSQACHHQIRTARHRDLNLNTPNWRSNLQASQADQWSFRGRSTSRSRPGGVPSSRGAQSARPAPFWRSSSGRGGASWNGSTACHRTGHSMITRPVYNTLQLLTLHGWSHCSEDKERAT